MARCLKYDEDECIGHDCIDRVGTPCIFDKYAQAGTEDFVDENDTNTTDMIIWHIVKVEKAWDN